MPLHLQPGVFARVGVESVVLVTGGAGRAGAQSGDRVRSAVESVNGRRYTVQQGAQLYGTSGSSEDWAFARHILDPTRPVIDPYPIRVRCERPDVAASFHPPYAEMETIIDEVAAGLLEMCLAGLDRLVAQQLP